MIFIIPSTDVEKSQGHLRDMVIHTLPFGIAALSSILERDGLTATIINDNITSVTQEMILEFAKSEPCRPVFGITSVTLQAYRAKEIFHLIKRTIPDAAVIVGGIHATAMPEEFLEDGFEYVFSGEADLVISELASCLAEKKDVSHIPGLIWKDSKGTIHRNNPARLIELKELPLFPYHLFEGQLQHYDLGAVMSSRGCPYKCVFCSQRTITGPTYRTRPVEHILSEIDILIKKYNVNCITFFDDNFVVNKEWVFELCNNLISGGYNKTTRFMCQMRGDAVTKDLLEILKTAGFDALSFGIETGSEKMAQIIKKGESVESNIKAVRLAKEYGFVTLGTFIIGFPSETAEDREKTLKLAMDLPLNVLRVNIAIPYPGTPLYDIVKHSLTVSEGWANFNVVSPLVTGPFSKQPLPYVPDGTTEEEIRFLMLWTNLKFWLRPTGLISFFMRKSTFVTRMVPHWYIKPRMILGFAKVGITTFFNLVWVAFTALKFKLIKFKTRLI